MINLKKRSKYQESYFILLLKDARRPFAATVGQQRGDAEYGIVALPDDYQV